MNDEEQVDYIVEISTQILKKLEALEIEPVTAWAALGNAFSRLSKGLGYDAEGFRDICNQMADRYDLG